MKSSGPSATEPARPSFEEDTHAVVTALKRAIGDLLDVLPVDPASGPTQVGRNIKIDTKLAWKITNLLDRSDPMEAGLYIPGMAALKRFLAAATRFRPPVQLTRAVRSACADFERLVKLHGGDRRSFDMLLAGQAPGELPRTEMEHRKAAYQSNSFLWGVQARAQLKTVLLAPCADAGLLDAVVITGFVGLRRIRSHVPWRVTSAYSVDDRGIVRATGRREPLDPAAPSSAGGTAVPLLTRFCSAPAPELVAVQGEGNGIDFALEQGPIGRTAAETCLIGELLRGAEPRYRSPDYEYNAVVLRMKTPCETVILDVLVHEELFPAVNYQARMFSDLFSGRLLTYHLDCDELKLHERVEHLGKGPKVARTAAIPRYRDLLGYAFERTGWSGDRFDVYRVTIHYPATPTVLVLRQPLPEKRGG